MIDVPEIVIERVAGVVGAQTIDISSYASAATIAATGFHNRRVA